MSRPDDADPTVPLTIAQLQFAVQGDRAAFGELLERYGVRIRDWIRRQGVRDQQAAQDLEQDVHVKLIGRLRTTRFDDVGSFRAYVKRTCASTVIDHFRRLGRSPVGRHLESLGPTPGSPLDPRARDPSPLSEVAALEDGEARAREAAERRARIALLPTRDRELVHMREELDMEFAAIAEAQSASLGKTVRADAVRMKYGRLLKKIGAPVPAT